MGLGFLIFGLIALFGVVSLFSGLKERTGCGCLAFVITVLAVMTLLLARIL